MTRMPANSPTYIFYADRTVNQPCNRIQHGPLNLRLSVLNARRLSDCIDDGYQADSRNGLSPSSLRINLLPWAVTSVGNAIVIPLLTQRSSTKEEIHRVGAGLRSNSTSQFVFFPCKYVFFVTQAHSRRFPQLNGLLPINLLRGSYQWMPFIAKPDPGKVIHYHQVKG